jgi:hypothetical protein
MNTVRRLLVVTTSLLASALAQATPQEDTATALRNVVLKNEQAAQAEDAKALMATIDPQSPAYATTQQENSFVFATYDLKYELLSFRYLGDDGEFAAARVKQKTTRTAGAAFRNNELDLLVIFRQENGQWKIWSQMVLNTKFLEEPAAGAGQQP